MRYTDNHITQKIDRKEFVQGVAALGVATAGRKYKLADIVPEDRRGELLRKVREDIAIRHYEAKSYAEWRARKEIAFFDEPQLTENFYFDDRAIHFIYNQYEIACYADGIIEAIVPR